MSEYPHDNSKTNDPDKTKTAWTKIAKLGTGIVITIAYLAHQWILGQKVKGQLKATGSKSAKSRDETAVRRHAISLRYDAAQRDGTSVTAGVSYALYRVS